MKTIRYGVFETNSSSEHAIAYAKNKEEVEKFQKGELWLDRYENRLVTPEEMYENLKAELGDKFPSDFTFEVYKFFLKYPDSARNFYISNDSWDGVLPKHIYSYEELTDLSNNWTYPDDNGVESGIVKEKGSKKYRIVACWRNG